MILTQREQGRLQVLNSLLAEHMTLDQAAVLMGVSPRHTRRILAAYREKGAAAIAHGHRGRRPTNATPDAVATAVVRLARTRYAGTNHSHLSELLSEREGLDIGRTTLRRILVKAGLSSPRQKRPPKHRVRRQRMPREGMLVQMDGSHHPWLGDRVPPFTLLIAVDDATGPFLLSGVDGLGERWKATLESLHSRAEDKNDPSMITDGMATDGRPAATPKRKPTFLQKGRWKAIQKARRKGMSLRAIERELGIHRATIKKYMDAEGPPARQSRVVSSMPSSGTIET